MVWIAGVPVHLAGGGHPGPEDVTPRGHEACVWAPPAEGENHQTGQKQEETQGLLTS